MILTEPKIDVPLTMHLQLLLIEFALPLHIFLIVLYVLKLGVELGPLSVPYHEAACRSNVEYWGFLDEVVVLLANILVKNSTTLSPKSMLLDRHWIGLQIVRIQAPTVLSCRQHMDLPTAGALMKSCSTHKSELVLDHWVEGV